MLIDVKIIKKNFNLCIFYDNFMLIYVNITDRQTDRRTDKHIKSIVRNLTKLLLVKDYHN